MAGRFNKKYLSSLIYPVFVKGGKGVREQISAMPGVNRYSPDTLLEEAGRTYRRGIDKFLLFGIPDKKDDIGTEAYAGNPAVGLAVSGLKRSFPEITVMTDVCLCAYTTHGHCGILSRSSGRPSIDRRKSLDALIKMALLHASRGADYVAPSAMIRGQVAAIRRALDKNGYKDVRILAYSAKFASQFYGPFRDAAGSAPKFGNREGYQLAPAAREEALMRIRDDINEGADIVMVKPALSYLDIAREAKKKFKHPLTVYNVSGEYAMVKWGSQSGYLDERKAVSEIISSIKRAGADFVVTYHAPDIARWSAEKD